MLYALILILSQDQGLAATTVYFDDLPSCNAALAKINLLPAQALHAYAFCSPVGEHVDQYPATED